MTRRATWSGLADELRPSGLALAGQWGAVGQFGEGGLGS
jgi:hypothetical protein